MGVFVQPGKLARRCLQGQSAPAEFGWQVHAALEGWATKVDVKASILLAFQGGTFIFSATSPQVMAGSAGHRPLLAAAAGMMMLVIAMALAATAILPSLGSSRRHRADHASEWIYFGHVRLWKPTELAERLSQLSERDEILALSAQLVRVSRLNWRKHRLLQASVLLTLLAMVAMMGAMTLRAGI
jgi:hypothetical protein